MPCVFAIQNRKCSPFHRTRQWCPQCWQTATLLVTISSRRGGGRFPFRSASCDQITGRNSSLNGHIHQPISSHHAKLWRVARRSRTSSTRTSRLRQRGHFMQSTPFLLWICTHYTACTPPLQSLFRHFVLRAFFLFIFWRDIRRHRCADFLRRTPRNRLIHRPRCVLPNHKVVDVCLLQHIPC